MKASFEKKYLRNLKGSKQGKLHGLNSLLQSPKSNTIKEEPLSKSYNSNSQSKSPESFDYDKIALNESKEERNYQN